ncbi:unnamed protein product [Gongylonema pulchrum]|uniref:C2H2-type domain-containing protein n=1 Tax=Gongylonema pulchrum TaxID=637853 RepID=A0A183DX77_9BILA|nr:unnamed protein product [Gongylonema pulchrum]
MDEEAMATCSSSESVLVVPPAKILKAVSALHLLFFAPSPPHILCDRVAMTELFMCHLLVSAAGLGAAGGDGGGAATVAAVADGTLKNSMIRERMSPASVDSVVLPCSLPLCQPSCSSSPSPITISRTSVEITTLSTSFTAANTFTTTGPKTTDEFCVDAHLLEKTSPPQRLRSSSLPLLPSQATNEVEKKQPEVLSTSASDSNVAELPECSSLPSSSELSVKLNECDLGIPCRWSNCLERFQHDNDLYDHVVKVSSAIFT